VVRTPLGGLTDERIEELAAAIADYDGRWAELPPGGKMQLRWPLPAGDLRR
jgi:hypothetical protein